MAPFYLATPRASLVDLHKYAAGSLRRHRSSTYHRSPRVVLPLRCWANTPPTTNSTSSAGSNAQEDATASPPDDGDSPTSLYLRHQLRVTREQYALLVQRCPDVAAADLDACVKPSVELLVKLAGAQAVQRMLISTPLLLVCSLVDWYDFLVDGYGLSKAHFARTLDTHPQLVLHGSLYNAGQARLCQNHKILNDSCVPALFVVVIPRAHSKGACLPASCSAAHAAPCRVSSLHVVAVPASAAAKLALRSLDNSRLLSHITHASDL